MNGVSASQTAVSAVVTVVIVLAIMAYAFRNPLPGPLAAINTERT